MLDNVEVVVAQHGVFECVVFRRQELDLVQRFFFAKIVEHRRVVRRAGVERTLDRLRRAVFVLHVVGEHHQLRDVDEAPKFGITAARDDAMALGQHAFTVVGFLHLDKGQRHAVDEQGDVGPKLVVTVFAGQFRNDVEAVVVEIFEVDQAGAGAFGEPVVKRFTKVLVIEQEFDVRQQAGNVIRTQFRIDAGDGFVEERWEDVGVDVPSGVFQGQIAVTQPHQVQDAGDFDP